MTEYEKMVKGLIYNPGDEEIMSEQVQYLDTLLEKLVTGLLIKILKSLEIGLSLIAQRAERRLLRIGLLKISLILLLMLGKQLRIL